MNLGSFGAFMVLFVLFLNVNIRRGITVIVLMTFEIVVKYLLFQILLYLLVVFLSQKEEFDILLV